MNTELSVKSQRIFYSWQSDSDSAFNRSFIEDCLNRAIAKLRRDDLLDVLIDRDTKGIAGMPSIGDTIFDKIGQSSVVVADLSIINPATVRRPEERAVSNPNVLFELGYAFGKLGASCMIGVFNATSGTVEELPFDLRPKRVVTYEYGGGTDRPAVRSQLVERLTAAIRECLGETADIVIERNSRAHEIMKTIWILGTEAGDWFGDRSILVAVRENLLAAEELPSLLHRNRFPVAAEAMANSVLTAVRRASAIEPTEENWSEISGLLTRLDLYAPNGVAIRYHSQSSEAPNVLWDRLIPDFAWNTSTDLKTSVHRFVADDVSSNMEN